MKSSKKPCADTKKDEKSFADMLDEFKETVANSNNVEFLIEIYKSQTKAWNESCAVYNTMIHDIEEDVDMDDISKKKFKDLISGAKGKVKGLKSQLRADIATHKETHKPTLQGENLYLVNQ